MQSLSLKYRPKNYDDLIGQGAVSKSLKYALENQKIANAYLFSGLRGSGKTSSARILAKALNCERGISARPCGMCASCTSADGLDIYELDAASNRGIDSIQDLIENTKYAPLHSRFKIFIIDEVHMLTREAFNALLKTLEEPPSHVKFILATTDAHKLPATILSRVLHFRFKKIPNDDIVKRMEYILQNEQIPYEKDALSIIARSSGGSLRDALTLLEQGIIYSQKELTKQNIAMMLGLIEPSVIKDFFNAILNSNDDAIFSFINHAKGYEISLVLEELSEYLKSSFFDKNPNFSLLIYDRFFHILAKAKNMAKISDDDEFILCVLCFMFKDAVKLKSIDEELDNIDDEIEKNNENEKKYNDFVTAIAKRDYELGEMFKNRASFISYDGIEFCIKINPANELEKSYFRKYYSSVIKVVFASLFSEAKLVLISDISKQSQEKQESKQEINQESKQELTQENTQTANNFVKAIKEPEVEPIKQVVSDEIKYPEYQSDEFLDNPISDDLAENEFEIPEEILDSYEDNIQDILFEALEKIKIENNCLELFVIPPQNESEKALLRNVIKDVLGKCSQYFGVNNNKIINSAELKKKLQ